MHYGVILPHYLEDAPAERIAQTARDAERLGFDSVWVSDHIVVPGTQEMAWARVQWEALTVLAHVAGMTRRVRLGTSVLVLPFRHAVWQAKALSTLDQLSGGRLIVGAGLGGLQHEFEALGVPFNRRGAMVDEALQVFRVLWTQDNPSFRGRYYQFSDLAFEPKPAQRPGPPILVGGHGGVALRRAVAYGDGWHPVGRSPDDLAPLVRQVRQMARDAGKERFDITLRMGLRFVDGAGSNRDRLHGSPEQIVDDLKRYAEVGVDAMVLDLLEDIPGISQAMERLAAEVLPNVQG